MVFGLAVEPGESKEVSKEADASETAPKLSEAAAIVPSRGIAKPPPVLDAVKIAQDKRARELARLRGEITFDDLKFDIEKDELFEDAMLTDEIRKLDEKKVRIRGFMLPSSVFQTKGINRFVLVRDNQECCFGPGAAIYDCIMVDMAPGKTAEYTPRVMTVSGVFSIDTESFQYPDGGHYAIFKIVATEAK